jgi:SAM-dependent methyltransferase
MVVPKLMGRRDVLDLGAGLGILGFFVKHVSSEARVRCVEWDCEKAAAAKLLLAASAQVECGDARTAELGQPDAIVLLDVLHYSPPQVQKEFLSRCIKALGSDGMLVVRELSKRSSVAEWFEVQAVRRGWNKGQGVFLWPIDDLVAFLKQHGFSVETAPAGRGLFTANVLIVARNAVERSALSFMKAVKTFVKSAK